MNQARQGQQVELNLGVEIGAKGQKGSDAAKTQHLARALGGKALKESFTLNFESLFLDMFTEVPGKPAVKPAEPTRVQDAYPVARREDAPAPVARIEAPAPAREVAPAQAQAPKNEAPAQAEARDDRPVEAAQDGGPQAEAKVAERPAEAAKDGDGAVVTHVKMVKIELTAHLQKALSAEEIAAVGEKLREIATDEKLEPAEMYAGMLEVVASLLSPKAEPTPVVLEAAAEVVSEPQGEEMSAFQKFLRRFAAELKQALPEAKIEAVAEKPVDVAPALQQRVDETLQKLVAKMDRRLTAEDRAQVAELVQKLQAEQNLVPETKIEAKVEAPRAVEVRREAVRIQALEVRSDEGQKMAVRYEAAAESVVVDLAKLRKQSGSTPVATASTAAIGGVEASGRAGRSDGQGQAQWQNSYNNNAAMRNADRAQSSERAERPRPLPQAPVFDQIVQSARILVTEGKSEAVIRLRPQELGQVEMKVTVEDNKVTVKFTAENQAVRAAITENIAELKKSLSELGLDVENVLVNLAGQFQNGEQPEEQEQGAPQSGRRRGRGGVDEIDADAEEFSEVLPAVTVADGSTVRYVA